MPKHKSRLKNKPIGYHPRYRQSFQRFVRDFRENGKDALKTRTVSIKKFFDCRHPEVYVLPGQEFLIFTEDDIFAEDIFLPYRITLPFSSCSFYVDLDHGGLFHDLMVNPALWRLSGISQLAFLVPPEKWELAETVYYLPPFFKHTRWHHSYLCALLAYVILARQGFKPEEIIPFVLAAGTHDIAIPAGGDSVIRIDPSNLHEEHSYNEVMLASGLAEKWRSKYGFNLGQAKNWVENRGVFGGFLDVLDKMSYTTLDCLALAREDLDVLTDFLSTRPLLMDAWQDIRFTPDHRFYFRHPGRLYDFLYLRALEHKHLLFHPRARALDFLHTKYVGRLYRSGAISKNDLIANNDLWLQAMLENNFPDQFHTYVSPDELDCYKFSTSAERETFITALTGRKVDHLDDIKKFNLCLDWLVLSEGKLKPLHEAIAPDKIAKIERIPRDCAGYYVYLEKTSSN
jgi:hypothetical protein